ncbi:Hypothetical predicted protein [Lynx pardinus]|nr:Hypothetical predicted protein [Lynx pardinus]
MAKRVQARRLDGIDHDPWVEFVKMASEFDAVNLGQGFPDFPPPDFAVEAFQHALSSDFMLNQYTRAFGYPPLTKILASFFGKLLGQEIDPLKNVLVTVGAYGALFTAFQALVEEGDEVIIIEPFFDCYEPMTLMAGGHPVFVTLKPGPTRDGELDSSSNWQLDPTELASKFTSHTKALILNTPNNPVGKVFSKAELELVASLCQQHDVICIADEVYQWLVYDGYQHVSIGEPSQPGCPRFPLDFCGWAPEPNPEVSASPASSDPAQRGFCLPESKMPDLPGDVDEPYDRRFIKWMIKTKMSSHPEKEEKKKWKDLKLMKKLERQRAQEEQAKRQQEEEAAAQREDQGRPYTLSVALPGSILDNAQSPELRTYLAGQIARACTIFCVDEIVVFDEEGQEAKTVEGEFRGVGKKGQACVQLARILQYLECPQYLRKAFFPKHQDLQFAGLLNPLDSPHHMRQDEESEFREGIVVDRPTRPGHGSFVNCGMKKEVKIDKNLEPGLRVTVQLNQKQLPESKTYRGKVVSSQDPRTKAGLYWGYTVRLASCLSAVFAEAPFQDGYDLTIGTSERGSDVASAQLPSFRWV